MSVMGILSDLGSGYRSRAARPLQQPGRRRIAESRWHPAEKPRGVEAGNALWAGMGPVLECPPARCRNVPVPELWFRGRIAIG